MSAVRRHALALGLCALASAADANPAATRAGEVASCRPGELVTWPDGVDRPAPQRELRLVYRHTGAPPGFSEAVVRGAVRQAAQAWSACGVPAEVLDDPETGQAANGTVAVLWDDAQTRGNFALANLGQRRLALSPAMFRLLAQRNPRHPAEQTLQMAISHEMGHFLGLMAHSRRCADVMSYYDDGQGKTCFTRDGSSHKSLPEYRSPLPTACDIARCRSVNAPYR